MNSNRAEKNWIGDELRRTGRRPLIQQVVARDEPRVTGEEAVIGARLDPAVGLAHDEPIVAIDRHGRRSDRHGEWHWDR